MTTIIERPNPARERFLEIMRERQSKPQQRATSTGEARETVKAWRNAIKSLSTSRERINKPKPQPRKAVDDDKPKRKAAANESAKRAREFVQAEMQQGKPRPASKLIVQMFNVGKTCAKQVVRDFYGINTDRSSLRRSWATAGVADSR